MNARDASAWRREARERPEEAEAPESLARASGGGQR